MKNDRRLELDVWRRAPLRTADRVLIGLLACSAAGVVLSLVFWATGCHVGELAAPCDSMSLDVLRAQCHQAVRQQCARNAADVVDESCPTLVECQRRIESWRACVDGGAP